MTTRSGSWATAIAMAAVMTLASQTAAADDYKGESIPLGEAGLIMPVTLRRQETQKAMGATADNGIDVGLGVRAEAGLLPLLLNFNPRLRLGDYIGVDLGISSHLFVGRIVLGLQISYELTDLVGIGARVYYHTVIEDLFVDYLWNNFVVGEVAARVGKVTGRVRFQAGQTANSGYETADYGASIRIPTGKKIMGVEDWSLAADYDWLWTEESSGTAVYHRFVVGIVKGF
jgi:hypothetical protein